MKRFVLAVDAPSGMPLNTWIPLAVYPRTLPALVSTTGSLIFVVPLVEPRRVARCHRPVSWIPSQARRSAA